jgi:DNA polymerase I
MINNNTILLVDGSNQAYRAFFAMSAKLRSPSGMPTNAIYGLIKILLKIINDIKPIGALVVFDTGSNFRTDLFPDYKGHRPEMPEELRAQWPQFMPLCETLGISAYSKDDGFEADDVIGTLAVQFSEQGYNVQIVSNDKDFSQLVNDRITLFNPIKNIISGVEEITAKYGVTPEQFIDFLALCGDSSDNIPGIRGVGEKTAAKLLTNYKSWQGLVENVENLKGKMKEKVKDSIDQLPLYVELVTIRTDMKLNYTAEDLRLRGIDGPNCLELFLKYGFRSLVRDLDLEQYLKGLEQDDYVLIQDETILKATLEDLSEYEFVSVDLETTSLNTREAKIVGVSLCSNEKRAYYVPVGHVVGENCPNAMIHLGPFLSDPSIAKVGQNLKYDRKVLLHNGYDLCGIFGDSMLRDYVRNVEQKHNLDRLSLRYLKHTCISYDEATKSVGGQFALLSPEQALKYAAEDAHVAFLLQEAIVLPSKVKTMYEDIEVPLISILAEVERTGIKVDVPKLNRYSEELGTKITELEDKIYKEAGKTFNINSTQQLAKILFEERNHTPTKKSKSGFSTGVAVLKQLASVSDDLLPDLILRYREVAKLKSTYVDPLPIHVTSDGRIHTSFHQALTETGRLSSSKPNLQNIPVRTEMGRKVRSCFIAEEGHSLISADYSQIELRILAHFCKKGNLVQAFKSGIDVHQMTGEQLAGGALFFTQEHRRAAKAINYGLMYGMSAFRLSKELKISFKQATDYIQKYFDQYPQVRIYMDSAIEMATKKGYSETMFRRRRAIFGLTSKNKIEREAAQRLAMNSPIQGTAADIMKIGMIRVHERLKKEAPRARILLQVHDELVIEVPTDLEEKIAEVVRYEMVNAAKLCVPLEVNIGIGQNWNDIH